MIHVITGTDKRKKDYMKIIGIEIIGGQYQENSLIQLRDVLNEVIEQGFTDYKINVTKGYYDTIEDVIIEPHKRLK